MARPKGDPTDLIRRLDAALKVAKPRDVVDAKVMSEILSMTWRNFLVTHIEPDAKFPIQRRGAEGVPWEFRVVKVLRHMVRRARERIEANEAAARRVLQLTNITVPPSEESISLVDLNKLADLTIKSQAQKIEQRRYIPAEKVRLFLNRYNSTVRDAILGTTARMDPAGDMDAALRTVIDNELRDVAVSCELAVQDFLREWNAGLQPGGAS